MAFKYSFAERKNQIADLVRQGKSIVVKDLSEIFNVSEMTII